MSQYGNAKTNAPPPWANQTTSMLQRPAFSESSGSTIRASPVTYQAPQQLGQQSMMQQAGLTPAMLVQQQINQSQQVPYGLPFQQAQQQLLSQQSVSLGAPGIALPTTLATTQPVMTAGAAGVTYPAPRAMAPPGTAFPAQQSVLQSAAPQPKQRVFTGTITKMHDNFGFVDEDVFFQTSCIKGQLPKVGDRVLVEAQYNASMPFKWNATRIQVLPNQSAGLSALTNVPPPLPASGASRSQAALTRGPPTVVGVKTAGYNAVPPPAVESSGGNQGSGSNFGNRLPHSGRPRSPIRRMRGSSKDRRRSRERDSDSRKRSRSPRRRGRLAVRYSVHVPKVSLDMSGAGVLDLKKRYNNLYVPSDFFLSRFLCADVFPLERPFQFSGPVSFHVFPKDVEPVVENDAVYEPPDIDYKYCAKVMLLTTPGWEEMCRRTTCLAEEDTDSDNLVHPSRVISFLVGLRGKNETMAIGGPWSPSLDGADPEHDPQVLIRTAIRTCRALTGIDLSLCTKWYRLTEIFYRRGDKSTETVVIYLPDTTPLAPSRVAWEKQQSLYRRQMEAKLNPAAAAGSQDDKDEDGDIVLAPKQHPSHWSELDPKSMKVAELRQELELRTLSPKGLKSQLIARLTKVLKTEEETEEEEKASGKPAAPKPAPPPTPVVTEPETEEDEETRKKEEAERRALEKKYYMPDSPQVVVHPHRTAKSGKFDCTVMSLSVLLDYRPEDNKEHSFEVSLFAEVFNEMLMRDAGFSIYRSLVDAPEKPKEEKKSKDKKETSGGADEDKDDKDGDKNEDEDNDNADENMYTADKRLLMSFSYFDTSHCDYIVDKDLEEILYTIGLNVTRAQARKLIQKVTIKDMVRYRKLTDRPVPDDGEAEKVDETKLTNPADLAKGNRQYLPAFVQSTGASGGGRASSKSTSGDESVMVTFEGSLVDLASLMSRVRKSDQVLLETESRMAELQQELKLARSDSADQRSHTEMLEKDLSQMRGQVAQLHIDLHNSQESVNKYTLAVDAVFNAIAPLVVEAEAKRAPGQEAVKEEPAQDGAAAETAELMETDVKEEKKEEKKEETPVKKEAEKKEPASDKKESRESKKRSKADTPDSTPKKKKVENGATS